MGASYKMDRESEILCLDLELGGTPDGITGRCLHLQVTNRYNENSPKFMVWTDCHDERHHVRALIITPKAVQYADNPSRWRYTLADGQSDKLNAWLQKGYAMDLFGQWHAGYF